MTPPYPGAFPPLWPPKPPTRFPEDPELIKEAGFTRVPVNMQILNATLDLQVAQIVQAMAREVGFDITIEPQETGTRRGPLFRRRFRVVRRVMERPRRSGR